MIVFTVAWKIFSPKMLPATTLENICEAYLLFTCEHLFSTLYLMRPTAYLQPPTFLPSATGMIAGNIQKGLHPTGSISVQPTAQTDCKKEETKG